MVEGGLGHVLVVAFTQEEDWANVDYSAGWDMFCCEDSTTCLGHLLTRRTTIAYYIAD
jgi:hypothetical protein